jgi:hypothetical protein
MKMAVADIGMGLICAQNETISLVGGYRSGSSGPETTRLKYSIYDNEEYGRPKNNGMSDAEKEKACTVGFIELFIKNGTQFDVAGLVNIEINKEHRKKGYAHKVIASLMATAEGDLKIHDIKKHYVSAWRKLGVTSFVDIYGQPMVISKAPKNQTINGVISYNEFVKEKSAPKLSEDSQLAC